MNSFEIDLVTFPKNQKRIQTVVTSATDSEDARTKAAKIVAAYNQIIEDKAAIWDIRDVKTAACL